MLRLFEVQAAQASQADPLAVIAIIVAIGVFLLEIALVVVAAVWAVSKIKGTTDRLNDAIKYASDTNERSNKHLEVTVEQLREWLKSTTERVQGQNERLIRVESTVKDANRKLDTLTERGDDA